MAIEIISAEDVLSKDKGNRTRAYPSKMRDGYRLQPFAEVTSTPKFTFAPDAKIFTAGSCFARNVERSLMRSGYAITSSADDFYNPFPDRTTFQRYNKYTIHSILNEIKWALGETPMETEKLLCETKPGLYCDLQTSGDSLRGSLEDMSKFRESFNSKFIPVAEADVVIITLGLVECWYDNLSGTYLNRFPGPLAVKNNPDRFSLHVLDYDEIYAALCETYETIARHNDSFNMLVTVSPVPLDRTFRPQDVLVANTYSKSVQRAAVEAFVAKYPADYFPSFETVTLSDTKYAWSDNDFRHVRSEIVDRIMGRVLENYTTPSEVQSAQKTRGYVTSYLAAGDLDRADEMMQAHIKDFGLSLGLMYQAGDIAFRRGKPEEAATILREMIASVDKDLDAANAALEDRAPRVRNMAVSLLEQCQRMMALGEAGNSADMERQRALSVIDAGLKADPENEDLSWLRSYLERSATGRADDSETKQSLTFLQEVSAISKFRAAVRAGDIPKAEKIAQEAIKQLGFSEMIQWELGLMYRQNDRLEESFDIFYALGQFGGAKAVPAVRHALRLAQRLGKDEALAELADEVAKQLQ